MYHHVPVLLKEAIEYLHVTPGMSYVDCTLGGGGYTRGVLELLQGQGQVLAIDQDKVALEHFKSEFGDYNNLILEHGNFRDFAHIISKRGLESIAGIVADIGVSSYHFDSSGRGFSFQKDEPLDMRMDPNSDAMNAEYIVNFYPREKLARILADFGEERFASRIASRLVSAREKAKIKTTSDLKRVVLSAVPRSVKPTDVLRRVFQAIRIEVNGELDALARLLEDGFNLLAPGGRMVIVTFHSLEDTMVKNYFKSLAVSCVCPKDFPHCVCGRSARAQILTKKVVVPSEFESTENSRSNSGKLRAIEKI